MQWKLIKGAHGHTGGYLQTTKPRIKCSQGKSTHTISYWKGDRLETTVLPRGHLLLENSREAPGAVFHPMDLRGSWPGVVLMMLPFSLQPWCVCAYTTRIRFLTCRLPTRPTKHPSLGSDPLSWGPCPSCAPGGVSPRPPTDSTLSPQTLLCKRCRAKWTETSYWELTNDTHSSVASVLEEIRE